MGPIRGFTQISEARWNDPCLARFDMEGAFAVGLGAARPMRFMFFSKTPRHLERWEESTVGQSACFFSVLFYGGVKVWRCAPKVRFCGMHVFVCPRGVGAAPTWWIERAKEKRRGCKTVGLQELRRFPKPGGTNERCAPSLSKASLSGWARSRCLILTRPVQFHATGVGKNMSILGLTDFAYRCFDGLRMRACPLAPGTDAASSQLEVCCLNVNWP